MKIKVISSLLCLMLSWTAAANAHDTWVQTNTNLVRVGDVVFVDLFLGNHGNNHRDFKMAGKADRNSTRLDCIAPNGAKYDLTDRLTDNGYSPSEGYWSARFVPAEAGTYLVAHTMDKVVSYAPTRSIKSAKTYFIVSPSLDRPESQNDHFNAPLGHPLELVPKTHPVKPMGPGTAITVQVLFEGKPLPDARVTFIPRGEALAEEFDERYDRTSDAEGIASFTPKEGNYYLVAVHHLSPKANGPGYDSTKYSATLTVLVPQVCACCAD